MTTYRMTVGRNPAAQGLAADGAKTKCPKELRSQA